VSAPWTSYADLMQGYHGPPTPPPLSAAPHRTEFCLVCHGLRWDKPGVTYIARRQRWVKIGRTNSLSSVNERLRGLRKRNSVRCPALMDQSAPLSLIVVVGSDLEHDLHERYAAHHAVGEWFHAVPALLTNVARLEGVARHG
jgi:T5orf172 domain